MKNLKTRVLSLLMILSLVIAMVIPSYAADGTKTYSTYSNSGKRGEVCVTLDGTTADEYYIGEYSYDVLSGASASRVLEALRTLMTSTHTYSTSYSECRDYATRTDCQEENGMVTTLYTGYQATNAQYQNGSGWNREHVWPKSLGNPNLGQSGPGSDLHHIRPDENRTNSNRGNNLYGYVSGGSTSTGNLSSQVGGKYNSVYFEPNDNVKGDVARICLYMYVRYGLSHCQKITTVFQSVEVLLEWCALDPVDTWEMGRNEVVYAIQGNRNVFIDYPEYAWLIFGEEIPGDMTTPSGMAAEGNNGANTDKPDSGNTDKPGNEGGNETPDVGTDITNCKHTTGFYTENAKDPTCTEDGYSGDDYCNLCKQLIVTGMILQSEGHKFGEAEVITPATEDKSGLERRVCLSCGDEVLSSIPKLASQGNSVILIVGIAVGVVVILGVVIFLAKKRKGDDPENHTDDAKENDTNDTDEKDTVAEKKNEGED